MAQSIKSANGTPENEESEDKNNPGGKAKDTDKIIEKKDKEAYHQAENKDKADKAVEEKSDKGLKIKTGGTAGAGIREEKNKFKEGYTVDIDQQVGVGRVLDQVKRTAKGLRPRPGGEMPAGQMPSQAGPTEGQEGPENEERENTNEDQDDKRQDREETRDDNRPEKSEAEKKETETSQASEQKRLDRKNLTGLEKRQAKLLTEKENQRALLQEKRAASGSANALKEGAQKFQAVAKAAKTMYTFMVTIWRVISAIIIFFTTPVGIAILIALVICIALLLVKMALDDPCGLADAVPDSVSTAVLSMMGLTCTILNK